MTQYATVKDLFQEARARVTRGWIESMFSSSGAEWRGNDYFTINPLRDDQHIGSFAISDTGWYSDFADASIYGDVFQLLARWHGGKAYDYACEMADGVVSGDRSTDGTPTLTLLPTEKPLEVSHWEALPDYNPSGHADYVTRFTDLDTNKEIFVVTRRDTETGKEIRPWYFDGKQYVSGIPKGYGVRPLLPLKYFDAPVLVVEGEKCQQIAQAHFDKIGLLCSVTTWHGGAGAIKKIDARQLSKKRVVFWPDFDEVGQNAMLSIEQTATNQDCLTHILDPATMGDPAIEKSKGWDIVNALEEGIDIASIVVTGIASVRKRRKEVPDEADLFLQPDRDAPEDSLYKPLEAGANRQYMHTDLGNAERLVALFGDRIRYNYDKGAWMVCRHFTWEGNDPSAITPMVKEVLRHIGKEDTKFAFKCESGKSISTMLSLASREPGMPVREPAFDRDMNLFHCKNALLDVKTGLPVEGRPDMLISKTSEVEYDPAAECPRFLQFLKEITVGRQEIADFFQRWFGVSLSGDTSVQSFAIFFGHGANGKSTLTELIAKILGDYAKNAPPETFTVKSSGSGIPNDIAALRGARMVMATETESNSRLAESKIKSLTGGDMVSARYMRGEFFEFTPSWKIIISTNHKPRISGADHGIWRRIILVPFDFVATTEAMDPFLGDKLWEERSGILNWMIKGAVDYFAAGGGRAALNVPEIMLNETTEYRVEEDVVGRFLAEECYTKEEMTKLGLTNRLAVKAIHNSFKIWCEGTNELFAAKMSAIAFGKAMKDRGVEQCRMPDGSRGYINVHPRNDIYGNKPSGAYDGY